MRFLPVLILISVAGITHAHWWWWRPRWREATGSCTFELTCDAKANSWLSSVSFFRRSARIEMSSPFIAWQFGFYRSRYMMTNSHVLPAGNVTVPFTIRYRGFREPRYFCRLFCYSCTHPSTVPPTIPTNPPTVPPTIPTDPPTVPPTIPTDPPTVPPTIPTDPPTVPPTIPTDPPTVPTTMPTDPPTVPTTMPTDPPTVPTTMPTDPTSAPMTSEPPIINVA